MRFVKKKGKNLSFPELLNYINFRILSPVKTMLLISLTAILPC